MVYLDGKKKTQDPKSTKYLQKIEHTGIHIRILEKPPRVFESGKVVMLN